MKIKAKLISNISGTLFFSILFSMFFLISTSYAQEASSINVDGYSVGYSITAGSILSIIPDVDANSLVIKISSTSDGELKITLPRALIDAKYYGDDDHFFVLVDSEETDYDEGRTSSDRTLKIAFKAGTNEIEIIGNTLSGTTSEQEHEPEPIETQCYGAAIKLDQNQYLLSDDYYVTVVAPKENRYSYVVDLVTVLYSDVGKSEGKMILEETGTDTGIFTNTIVVNNVVYTYPLYKIIESAPAQFMISFYDFCTGDTIGVVAQVLPDDTTPPRVMVPSDMTIDAGTDDSVKLEYYVTAIDDVDGAITPTCDLRSGSVIYVGQGYSTLVTCTATDSAGNTGSDSFMVTITSSSDTTPPHR